MGRKSTTGGVAAKGSRIQYDFMYLRIRRRPTENIAPTKTNLRNAAKRMERIQQDIRNGTFSFADEFPDYAHLEDVANASAGRTVKEVCKTFIASLRARDELAYATVESYRKILAKHVLTSLEERPFALVTFSQLEEAANAHQGSKKTFNNVVSAIRQAWEYGYKDLPKAHNPAAGLECIRIPKREQPKPDPIPLEEAEARISKTRELWGEEQANYEEFRFFSGVRPSEEIALIWSDCDLAAGEVSISKARVMARDKAEPKNYEDRLIELCQRALDCLLRQRAIWSRLKLEGTVHHDKVFFREDGEPFHDLQVQTKRWRRTEAALRVRERDPYHARHSSVSWNLAIGKNLLWVAEQHGHSAAVMLKTYAKWMKGTEADVEKIRRAFGFATNLSLAQTSKEVNSLTQYGNPLAEREGFEPSSRVRSIKGLQQERSEAVPSDPQESPDLPPDLPLKRR